MKQLLAIVCVGAMAAGCGGGGARPQGSGGLADPGRLTSAERVEKPAVPVVVATQPAKVVATVGEVRITSEMIQRPLYEAYGLPFVLHLVTLELSKKMAEQAGVNVTAADVAAERQRTMEQAFKESVDTDKLKMTEAEKEEYRKKEYERLMTQLLAMKRVSKPEFELAIASGAHLRKVAEAQVQGKVKDEDLQEAFRIKYGEKVKVRQIKLANLREAAEALRKINDERKAFEEVAREMSRDERTKQYGGEIRPFTRAERMWPQAFKEAAFALKEPGDISDPVQIGDAVHLIKLVEKIAPSAAVKFEDHKEVLRAEMTEIMIGFRVKQLREHMALVVNQSMKIDDPVLAKQYQEQLDKVSGEAIKDPEAIRRDLIQSRPGQGDGGGEGAPGASQTGGSRPPATRPG